MKERIYISGPITGHDIYERRSTFETVQHYLEHLNSWKVFNPLKNGLPADAHRSEHMREDLKQLLNCTAIYMMKGWEKSAGCQLEFNMATQIGLSVFFEGQKHWFVQFATAKYTEK